MPTYDLVCQSCKTKTEVSCKYDDVKKIKCKKCKKKKMVIVPSLGNFKVKGPCYKNGWDCGGDE